MVAIPQTDGLPHPVGQSAAGGQTPSTPRKAGDVGRFLKRLNLEHNLHLPWNEQESPNKRRKSPGHGVTRVISFLFFRDPSALDGAIEELRSWDASLASEERKVNFLLERLNIAKTGCLKAKRTPRTGDSRRSSEKPAQPQFVPSTDHSPRGQQRSLKSGQPATRRLEQLPEPASPTLSVKHAPPLSYEMPANNFDTAMPSFKRPRSPQSLAEKLRSSSSARRTSMRKASGKENDPTSSFMLPPSMNAPASPKPGYTSVNTSFTSNGLNDSFWSNVQEGTQEDPGSPATTVDESFHTAGQEPSPDIEAPIFGLDGANDGGLDFGIHSKSQQTTNYGSSPRLEDATQLENAMPWLFGDDPNDRIQAREPQSKLSAPRPSTQSEFGGSLNDSYFEELDRRMVEGSAMVKDQLLSPPETDSQPNIHELSGRDRVRQIPVDGLSDLEMPHSFLRLPLDLRLEAMRVLKYSAMTATAFEAAWPWSGERSMKSLHELARAQGIKYERGCATDFKDHGLAAKLHWSGKPQGKVWNMELCPPRKDLSNAFERKFGRDRFLVVDVPFLFRPPKGMGLDDFGWLVFQHVKEMFKHEQHFAGRVWRQFLVQPKKSRRTGKTNTKGVVQVTFFAVRSEENAIESLEPVSITEVLDWAVQFSTNMDSPQCKMYSRLDLAASRTIATYQFARSEVEYGVEDQMPTDDSDDVTFHDWKRGPPNQKKSGEVMNDGCNKISTWAMRDIQKKLGLKHLPTAVQGRIMGAKGIWYRDDSDANLDEKPKTLIWISQSQIKVRQSDSSRSDPDKLTLNIVRTSGQACPSFLYADFLPIMTSQGVPRLAIEQPVSSSANGIAEDFLTAFSDRMDLGEWINRQSSVRQARVRTTGIDAIGGFPLSQEEQILQMLGSGFEPTQCEHLASQSKKTFAQYLQWIRENFKTQLKNSTMLIGIADPFGVLKPGEIHVGFSTPFEDAAQTRYNLRHQEALVSRLPSLGAYDMQRVRCVFHEKLSHLTDVVVFPSRGPRPLASKLQGGDYDGDTFVIIWEPSLVKHFRNAPVPQVEDGPDEFGIQVDCTKMGEMVQEFFTGGFHEQQVLEWIHKNTDQRMRPDMLGSITLMYEKVVYHDNGIDTDRAKQVLRLHDLMIDAAKQGYYLSKNAWDVFKKKHNLHKIDGLPDPAHRQFARGLKTPVQIDRSAKVKNKTNISDCIYFEVIEPALAEALKRSESLAQDATPGDADVGSVFCDMLGRLPKGSPPHNELHSLSAKVSEMKKTWRERTRHFKDNLTTWREVVEATRAEFEAIMPDDKTSETVQSWLYKMGEEPSWWEKLRASCLIIAVKSSTLMFCAAGYELCYLKAFKTGCPRPRLMRMDTFYELEPKKRKRKIENDVDDRNGDEGDEDVGDVAELGA